ncbi:HpcH/HpaI aldolase/citrate lyase family protein [Burkholderia singularis]|nr:CoA ester lyase [Burkholderia singularis]
MAISTDNPFSLMRTWYFVAGADQQALRGAGITGADVVIQELEDFTPNDLRAAARGYARDAMERWRRQGAIPGVRINPFTTCGLEDLESVMPALPAVVMMSKVETTEQVESLDAEIGKWEHRLGIPIGSTAIVPNIESALGIVNAIPIAHASARVHAMLVGTEDMVVDLGADRSREGTELFHPRARFLLECAAAGVLAIDSPYTFSDEAGASADMLWARSIGYNSKAVVNAHLVSLTNRGFTPSDEKISLARRQIEAFETSLSAGMVRAEVDGLVVERPSYASARRLVARHAQLSERAVSRAIMRG